MSSPGDDNITKMFHHELDKNLFLTSGIREIALSKDCPDSIRDKLVKLSNESMKIHKNDQVLIISGKDKGIGA